MAANTTRVAIILAAVDRASSVVNGAMNKIQNRMKKVSDWGGKRFQEGLFGAAFFGASLKAAADIETLQVALETAYDNNAQAAAAAFKEQQDFAARTPYQLDEVLRAHIKLKNMGLDPSIAALTSYGNTASAMGKGLNDMMEAVADAATGEFERLKEFGIRASSQGDKVTFTFKNVKTTVGKNAKEIEAYLKKVGNTHFSGGIDKQSRTLAGKFSTLKDNAINLMATIGNALVPAINKLFERIAPVLESVKAWAAAHPDLIQKVALVTVALMAFGAAAKVGAFFTTFLTSGIKLLSGVLKVLRIALLLTGKTVVFVGRLFLANPILLIIAAIAAAVYLVIKNWGPIKQWFARLWANVKRIFSNFISWVRRVWNGLKTWFMGIINSIADFFRRTWSAVANFFKNLWQGVKDVVAGIWQGVVAVLTAPIEAVKKAWNSLKDFFSGLWQGIKDGFSSVWSSVTSGGFGDIAEKIQKAKDAEAAANVVMASSPRPAMPLPGLLGGSAMPQLRPGYSSSTTSLQYSPTVNFQGTGTPADVGSMLQDHANQMFNILREKTRKENRKRF